MNNHTWKIMDLPHENTSLSYKWIFKTKMKVHSTINKYKTKLVLKLLDNKKLLNILTHIHLCQV